MDSGEEGRGQTRAGEEAGTKEKGLNAREKGTDRKT